MGLLDRFRLDGMVAVVTGWGEGSVVAFQGARAAATRMRPGGSIINIASGAGMRAAPNTGGYAAAKAGY